MKNKLQDPKYWLYRGKCRNCGRIEQWIVDKKMEWVVFCSITRDNKYPHFLGHCEGCHNEVVFDLMAMSARDS